MHTQPQVGTFPVTLAAFPWQSAWLVHICHMQYQQRRDVYDHIEVLLEAMTMWSE